MTKLINHQSGQTTKLLLVGNNGAGKTGSLASLAGAGYNIRFLDLDNGVDVLRSILVSDQGVKLYGKDAIERIDYETVTDRMKSTPKGILIPAKPSAWTRSIKLLENWDPYGPLITWTSQDVLVIDSLTMLCTAAMNYVLFMNNRLGQRPQLGDWGEAQNLVESLLQMLYDEGIKCNIIINAHIQTIEGDDGITRGFPMSLGNKLSPKIGTYFNTILLVKSTGKTRKILTQVGGLVELKNTAPMNVLPEYPIETGLAEYFKAVRHGAPKLALSSQSGTAEGGEPPTSNPGTETPTEEK